MLLNQILGLEEQLLKPEVRASTDALDRMISDQFVEFGSSGQTYTKRDVIAQLLAAPNVKGTFGDFQVVAVSDGVALATYRTGASLRSSVWRREGDDWKILFHQGTPIVSNAR